MNKEKILEKVKTKIAISNLKEENVVMKEKFNIAGKLGIAACVVLSMTGVAFAATKITKSIWKEPVKESYSERIKSEEDKVKQEITEDEKSEFVSEEDIVKSANLVLNKLGYEDTEFKISELVRGYGDSINYILRNENEIMIQMDPETAELKYFCDENVLSKNYKCDDITEEEAKNISKKIYEDLGILNSEYEIFEAKKQKVASGETENDFWQVIYCENNNGIVDKETASAHCFIVVNGKPISYIIKANEKESSANNEVLISEEEAKNIAISKEKEFSSLEIVEVNSEMSIEKMNVFIYDLENNIDFTKNSDDEYVVDDVSRVVYVVEIKHHTDGKIREYDLESIKEKYNKKYYIDATTGEIIGGKQAEFSAE